MGQRHTVLHQNIQALSNQKVVVEDDEAERQREDIVARSHAEEVTHALLAGESEVSEWWTPEAVAQDSGGNPSIESRPPPPGRRAEWERRLRGGERREEGEEGADGRRVEARKKARGGRGCSPDLASAPRRWDSLGSPCPRLCDFAIWVLDRNWAGRRGREAGTRDQVPRGLLGLELELDLDLALD